MGAQQRTTRASFSGTAPQCQRTGSSCDFCSDSAEKYKWCGFRTAGQRDTTAGGREPIRAWSHPALRGGASGDVIVEQAPLDLTANRNGLRIHPAGASPIVQTRDQRHLEVWPDPAGEPDLAARVLLANVCS